jgi:hypothetical protein
MCFVNREPLLRLFVRIVVEFVIDEARSERAQKFTSDCVWKLTGVDKNIRAGHRGEANNIRRVKAKQNS